MDTRRRDRSDQQRVMGAPPRAKRSPDEWAPVHSLLLVALILVAFLLGRWSSTGGPGWPDHSADVGDMHVFRMKAHKQFREAFEPCWGSQRSLPQRSQPPPAAVVAGQQRLRDWLRQQPPQRTLPAPAGVLEGAELPFVWPSQLAEFEHGCYSQTTEDGILLWIFALVGEGGRRAVEICSGVGYENSVANLALMWGWETLQVDGNADNVAAAQRFFTQPGMPATLRPPLVVQSFVTEASVGDLLRSRGFAGDVDLLSIDMDGMDYYVLRAALQVVSPRVIVVEVQDLFSWAQAITRPYNESFRATSDHYTEQIGVSLAAYVQLLRPRGYRFVGCIRLGFNAFFVHRDAWHPLLAEVHPASCFGLTANDFRHRMVIEERFKATLKYDWVDPATNESISLPR